MQLQLLRRKVARAHIEAEVTAALRKNFNSQVSCCLSQDTPRPTKTTTQTNLTLIEYLHKALLGTAEMFMLRYKQHADQQRKCDVDVDVSMSFCIEVH